MGRPQEHGEETRRLLLEEAGRLLAEEGAEAVTVRRLARQVGTTTRAVYSLFGNKQGLLSAMYREGADTMVRLHEAVPSATGPIEEILPLALAYRDAALAQPNLYGLIFERSVPGFTPSREDAEYARRSLLRVYEAVVRFAEQGFFGDRDPRAITGELWAMVHGLTSLELQGRLGPPETAKERWLDAVPALVTGLMRPREGSHAT
jgi:AcrR family transcriptional regulator